MREAVTRAFRAWADATRRALAKAGLPRDRAEPMGLAPVAAFEGALLMSRGLRSADAYDATVAVFEHALQ